MDTKTMNLRTQTPSLCVPLVIGLLGTPLTGCTDRDGGAIPSESTIPMAEFQIPTSDGLLDSPELQAVVDLQVARDTEGIRVLLVHPEDAVRARAALASASVQDSMAVEGVEALLRDPDPLVRTHAAFAMGQLPLTDGGVALASALESEVVPGVRLRLIEALGKRGGASAISDLFAFVPEAGDEELEWTLALARSSLRGVRSDEVRDELVGRLTHPDGGIREMAAQYFGRTSDYEAWAPVADQVRMALDGYSPGDPAAMHLVAALGRIDQMDQDEVRILHWLESAEDWRVRVNAVGAVRTPDWVSRPGVAQVLFRALDDPSEHVGVAASGAVGLALWNRQIESETIQSWIQGPVERWRTQTGVIALLGTFGAFEDVVAWTRRMADHHPIPTQRGIEVLAGHSAPELTEFFFEMAEHPEPLVRGSAISVLGQRWMEGSGSDEELERYLDLFRRNVMGSDNLPAARAAQALGHPAFQSLGAVEVLEQAFAHHRDAGDPNILVPLLESMLPPSVPLLEEAVADSDHRIRAAAASSLQRITGTVTAPSALEGPDPERTVDWDALGQIGPEPRIRFETEHGDLVARLFPEQAPLTVYTVVEQVRRGAYDGILFHRVVPNFVVQTGDFGMGDGSGSPGYRIRSEFTQIPFRRGVLGMASTGKDTEGSQFFITHAYEPHLDGTYTAFGWLEEGSEAVLDLLQQGDRILSVTLEPRSGADPRE